MWPSVGRPSVASACVWPGGRAEARDLALSALLPVPGTRDAVAALAYASGSSDAPPVALAVWSTVCDPCSCMNISYRVLSLSAFSRGTLEGNTFTMIGAGPTWSDRDRARWQLVEDPGLVELSRTSVQQAASPDEPSRLPEGVAQPASSLRVQNMSAPRVCQRGTRCAERDLRRDLPANCRRHALLCSAMHEDGTNGTPRVPHECRNHLV